MILPSAVSRFLFLAIAFTLLGPLASFADDEPLLMGVFPRRNATLTHTFFSPLAQHIAQATGREVRLIASKDFTAFWQGVKEKRYDIVHYNQYHYVRSHREQGYEVIVRHGEFGSATLSGAISVRKDSGIRSIKELRGKKIIFGGGKQAMVSYIAASYELRKHGLQHGDYIEEYAKNPPNAALALYHRQADAGGTGDIVWSMPNVIKQIKRGDIKILATSEPILHLPWAVKKEMDPQLRQTIEEAFMGLNNSAEGREILKRAKVTAIHKAVDSDYDLPRHMIKAVLGESY